MQIYPIIGGRIFPKFAFRRVPGCKKKVVFGKLEHGPASLKQKSSRLRKVAPPFDEKLHFEPRSQQGSKSAKNHVLAQNLRGAHRGIVKKHEKSIKSIDFTARPGVPIGNPCFFGRKSFENPSKSSPRARKSFQNPLRELRKS